MEKVLKIFKKITITLIVVLLSIVALFGVYSKQNNVWRNIAPEFNYGIELSGIRELRYVLDETEEEKNVYIDSEGNILGEVIEEETEGIPLEEKTTSETEGQEESTEKEKTEENTPNYATEIRKIKANEDSVKTKENFEKSKKIIQKRLENEDVYEYNIRLDTITGELVLEVPDNDNISVANSAVVTKGKIEIIDYQNGMILMDESDIKTVSAGMYQTETGYQACLEIRFNDEGKEKLKNISEKYRQVVDDAGESKVDYVGVNLDGQTLTTTYFGETLTNGILQLPMGNATTDSITMNETLKDVRRIVDCINEEELPIAYTLSSDNFIQSQITSKEINIAVIIFVVALVVTSIVLIFKFKLKGLMASIIGIGFVAILNIITRYTGIYVTLNSTIAFVCVVILNYVFLKMFLLENKDNENIKESFLKTMKKYYLTIIPVCLIAIVFTFTSNIVISSIGMILFWGLLIQALYNTITILNLRLI